MTAVTSRSTEGNRLPGLRRFATAITLLNILGHSYFGFEQSWATPLVALAVSYSMELLLETTDAYLNHRRPRFLGSGPRAFVDFLLSAHITGLAVGMLLYSNARLWPVAFASAAAISSKSLFRIGTAQGQRHFLNPSNFGISLTLLLFPWVGIAPPYQFTEALDGIGDWLLPALIVFSGSFLNWRFTKRIPVVASWMGAFTLQALFRHWFLDARLEAALAPMTGTAFILFSFYMVSDPATTPSNPRAQALFGASTGLAYGCLMALHVVFGLFFSLSLVCCARGAAMWLHARVPSLSRAAQKPMAESAPMALPAR